MAEAARWEAQPLVGNRFNPDVTFSERGDITVAAGANVSFIAAVTGYPPLSYQWSRDDTPLMSQTNPTLNLSTVTTTDAGTYVLNVSNALGLATSAPAVLTVTTPP